MVPSFAAPLALKICRTHRRTRCTLFATQAVKPVKKARATKGKRKLRTESVPVSIASPPPHPALPEANNELVLDGPGLLHGLLVGRPNRFIFNAIIPSIHPEKQFEAHSPAVGEISGHGSVMAFSLDGPVRALLSEAIGPTAEKRRTKYTVEALDIGAGGEGDTPVYCGINQTKSNSYLAHFLETDALPQILPQGSTIRREVTSPDGKSRIDFVAETPDGVEVWIENKTMLASLPIHESNPGFVEKKGRAVGQRPERSRMLKHWDTLTSLAATDGKEAVVVLTYLMQADRFDPTGYRGTTKASIRNYETIMKRAENTRTAGVRFVQVNFVFGEPDGEGRTAIRLGNVHDVI